MRRQGLLLAAGLLAASAALAQPGQARAGKTAHALHHETKAIASQQAEVRRLQHDVSAQEAGSRDAAHRLDQKDAQIAALRRQLQAAGQGEAKALPRR